MESHADLSGGVGRGRGLYGGDFELGLLGGQGQGEQQDGDCRFHVWMYDIPTQKFRESVSRVGILARPVLVSCEILASCRPSYDPAHTACIFTVMNRT